MAIYRCDKCGAESVCGPKTPAARGESYLCFGCFTYSTATEIPHEEGSQVSQSWNGLYHPAVNDGLSDVAIEVVREALE